MRDELFRKLLKEGPNGLSYEELLIFILGDECAEEVRSLLKSRPLSELKELIGPQMKIEPGVRESTMARLYAVKAIAAAWFG